MRHKRNPGASIAARVKNPIYYFGIFLRFLMFSRRVIRARHHDPCHPLPPPTHRLPAKEITDRRLIRVFFCRLFFFLVADIRAGRDRREAV